MPNKTCRTGVVGATGHTGRELIRLVRAHTGFELVFATSEAVAGAPVQGKRLLARRL